MFSLKFCTAMEWPAPISTWPRCCSSAFMGTTKKPAQPPIRIISTMATASFVTKIIVITMRPMATPIGSTPTARRSVIIFAAITAPTAMPTATTPCRYDACDRSKPSADRGPGEDDELERRAGAPEQRGRGERDLAQLVAPQQHDAVRELADEIERILARHPVVDAGVGNVQLKIAAIT